MRRHWEGASDFSIRTEVAKSEWFWTSLLYCLMIDVWCCDLCCLICSLLFVWMSQASTPKAGDSIGATPVVLSSQGVHHSEVQRLWRHQGIMNHELQWIMFVLFMFVLGAGHLHDIRHMKRQCLICLGNMCPQWPTEVLGLPIGDRRETAAKADV